MEIDGDGVRIVSVNSVNFLSPKRDTNSEPIAKLKFLSPFQDKISKVMRHAPRVPQKTYDFHLGNVNRKKERKMNTFFFPRQIFYSHIF